MSQPTYAPPTHTDGGGSRSNGTAIAALVMGIIALLLSWLPVVNIVSVILGIAALVTGFIGVGKSKEPGTGGRGMAISGLVTGVLALIVVVLTYTLLANIVRNNPEIQQEIERQQQEIERQQEQQNNNNN